MAGPDVTGASSQDGWLLSGPMKILLAQDRDLREFLDTDDDDLVLLKCPDSTGLQVGGF